MLLGLNIQAQEQLVLHSFLPEYTNIVRELLQPWAQAINTQGNGFLSIDIQSGQGKPHEALADLDANKADIILSLPQYIPGRLPSLEVWQLPLMSAATAVDNTLVLHQYMSKETDPDLSNYVPLVAVAMAPSLWHSSLAYTDSDFFKGQSVRTPSKPLALFLKNLGANPVASPPSTMKADLSSDVFQSVLVPWELVAIAKLSQSLKSHLTLPVSRGLTTVHWLLLMKKSSYEALTLRQKNLLQQHMGQQTSLKFAKRLDAIENASRSNVLKSSGIKPQVFSDDDWQKIVQSKEKTITTWLKTQPDRAVSIGQLALLDRLLDQSTR